MKSTVALAVVFSLALILLLLVSGCAAPEAPEAPDDGSIGQPPATEPPAQPPEISEPPTTEPPGAEEPTSAAECGNGIVEEGETCGSCPADVGCGEGELCCNNACVDAVCGSNADCDDGIESTEDGCVNPNTCEAECRNVKVVKLEVTTENWDFTPKNITVQEGDLVRITLRGLDNGLGNGHGFSLPAFGINQRFIKQGDEFVVEFTADEKGEFGFSCSVPCGSGHLSMKGTLTVE